MAGTHQSFLIIADITGYTTYLSESELEHAQEVLASLIGLLMESARPPLKVSGLEGDAVFSYALPGLDLAAQTFVEIIEQTYVAFRRAIDLMVLNNTCQCNACTNINNLDLKFFVHHGSFAIHRPGDREELVGSDVIYIHRILKNHIRESTGIVAYSAYTTAAVERLGLSGKDFIVHKDTFENLGDTQLMIRDMHPVWVRERERNIVGFPKDSVALDGSINLPMPPELVWDFLIRPEFRQVILGADRLDVRDRLSDGRIGEGSTFQCFHGNREVQQLILEWRPFERIVTRDRMTSKLSGLAEFALTPIDSGTRLTVRVGALEGPTLRKLFMGAAIKGMKKSHQRDLESFSQAVQAELARATS